MDWDFIFEFLKNSVFPVAINVLLALIIYLVGAKLIKGVLKLLEKTFDKTDIDEGVESFLKSAIKIVLYIVLIFAIVGFLGIETTGLAALFASAGVTVGLALQGSLSNLAGGVLILVLKPFKVGEYIIVGGDEGTVISIEILCTKLRTVDNKIIVIPNGGLANSSITNASREEFRRVDLVFGVSYESDLKLVKSLLQKVAESNELVLQDRDITIFINEFAASSIDFGFRVWCKNEDYWTVKWAMMEAVKDAFDANNIEIPFNQLDVHMQNK